MSGQIGRFRCGSRGMWLALVVALLFPVAAAAGQDKRPITFTRDVAPILQEK